MKLFRILLFIAFFPLFVSPVSILHHHRNRKNEDFQNIERGWKEGQLSSFLDFFQPNYGSFHFPLFDLERKFLWNVIIMIRKIPLFDWRLQLRCSWWRWVCWGAQWQWGEDTEQSRTWQSISEPMACTGHFQTDQCRFQGQKCSKIIIWIQPAQLSAIIESSKISRKRSHK